MVALATALQEVIGDENLRDLPDEHKHGVAFVFAGLPSVVDNIVNERVLAFLRRAVRHGLGGIPLPDVRDAYLAAVADSRPAKPRDCPPAWAKPRDCPLAWAKPRDCPLAWALAQGWGLSLGFAQRKDPSRCCRRLRVGISRPVLRVLELGRETRREGAPWRESCP